MTNTATHWALVGAKKFFLTVIHEWQQMLGMLPVRHCDNNLVRDYDESWNILLVQCDTEIFSPTARNTIILSWHFHGNLKFENLALLGWNEYDWEII